MHRRAGAVLGVVGCLLLLAGSTSWTSAVSDAELRVVSLGDSVPAGDACACTPFPRLVADDLGRRFDVAGWTADLAVGGARSADTLAVARSQPALLAGADLILVMTGANDIAPLLQTVPDPDRAAPSDQVSGGPTGADSIATWARDARSAVQAAASNVETLLAGLPPALGSRRVVVTGYWAVGRDGSAARGSYTRRQLRAQAWLTDRLDEALREVAGRHAAGFSDSRSAFRGVDGDADVTSLLTADGDHVDASGHRVLADGVLAALLPQRARTPS
ncbi:MAG: SGNH/GDSL hydrolase family protein [Janthinobacterium lividum]